jgi:TatA/E family protein of Tat protein translocase
VPFDGAFSPVHILIVLVVAFLVLGPDQLPKVARQAARGLNELRRVQRHLHAELRDVVSEFDAAQPPKPVLPPPEAPEDSGEAP